MTSSSYHTAPSANDMVVCAMSGGVDSCVAAYLLAKEGYRTLGVSMQVWDYRNHGGSKARATCCAPNDFTDARKVASKIGIPYYVFDFEDTFRERVITPFVESYLRGETPNPCIECNSKVKFSRLRERAEGLGCSHVATGHYAEVEEQDGVYSLLRGQDREKDQSYFLYRTTQEELRRTLFPVGHLRKEEVREIAREQGFVTAEKPESQDICFVSTSAGEFVEKIGGGRQRGAIVSIEGEKLGEHDGIHRFTVGQRRGLSIGGTKEALYVTDIQEESDTIIVGNKNELERDSFFVNDLCWTSSSHPPLDQAQQFSAIAQVRHRHSGCNVQIKILSSHEAEVSFLDERTTVAPGQAAVFYDKENRRVLGGGKICRKLGRNT